MNNNVGQKIQNLVLVLKVTYCISKGIKNVVPLSNKVILQKGVEL